MRMTINANTGTGGEYPVNQNGAVRDRQQRPVKNNIFGGDLKPFQDPVEEKRKQAREQAWKVVQNAWENDKSVDASVAARKQHYQEMKRLREEASASLKDVEDDKAAIQELYGVAEDSSEQQELELLEKWQDYKNGVGKCPTEEELDQIAEIGKKPLTEYQTRALELNDQAAKFKKDMKEAARQMRDDVNDVKQIGLERLKTHPMVDAKGQADAILDAANDQILGMLVEQAVDHIDEEQEEREEEARKASEQKKEEEERLEEQEEQRAVEKALILQTREAVEEAKAVERRHEAPDMQIEDILELTDQKAVDSKEVQQSLSDIKSSMKVLEADLKGIKVDEEV